MSGLLQTKPLRNYVQLTNTLCIDRLKYKDGQGVKTTVVCHGKDLKDKERNELKQLQNVELRFDDHLHAKCFYNEKSMVITSLNLYDYSQQNNREMGILLNSDIDTDVFNDAQREADFIVKNATLEKLVLITNSSGKEEIIPGP